MSENLFNDIMSIVENVMGNSDRIQYTADQVGESITVGNVDNEIAKEASKYIVKPSDELECKPFNDPGEAYYIYDILKCNDYETFKEIYTGSMPLSQAFAKLRRIYYCYPKCLFKYAYEGNYADVLEDLLIRYNNGTYMEDTFESFIECLKIAKDIGDPVVYIVLDLLHMGYPLDVTMSTILGSLAPAIEDLYSSLENEDEYDEVFDKMEALIILMMVTPALEGVELSSYNMILANLGVKSNEFDVKAIHSIYAVAKYLKHYIDYEDLLSPKLTMYDTCGVSITSEDYGLIQNAVNILCDFDLIDKIETMMELDEFINYIKTAVCLDYSFIRKFIFLC